MMSHAYRTGENLLGLATKIRLHLGKQKRSLKSCSQPNMAQQGHMWFGLHVVLSRSTMSWPVQDLNAYLIVNHIDSLDDCLHYCSTYKEMVRTSEHIMWEAK